MPPAAFPPVGKQLFLRAPAHKSNFLFTLLLCTFLAQRVVARS